MKKNNFVLFVLCTVMISFSILMVSIGSHIQGVETKVYASVNDANYFDRDAVMQVNITITDEEWQDLIENAANEEFKTVSVTINEDEYNYVQFRPKGNSSLRALVSTHQEKEYDSGEQSDTRFSFKLNFNDIIETQTLSGITQLNLNNCYSDPSYMREYLSYQIYEEMGLPVPQFCYAAVYINHRYHGLYLAVESILEPYLERNFDHFTGDLYKPNGNSLTYTGTNSQDLQGMDVKSSLKNANTDLLTEMLETLHTGDNIEDYVNVDGALRYIAVTMALVNYDSYLGPIFHNYYLYENEGVFSILPWDLNMSFGGFPQGSYDSLYIDEPTQGEVVNWPLVDTLLQNEEYLSLYHEYLHELSSKYLTQDYIQSNIQRITDLIEDYVKTDPTAFYTYKEFVANTTTFQTEEGDVEESEEEKVDIHKKNIPTLLGITQTMKTTIEDQLSGDTPATNNGKGSGDGAGMMGRPGMRNRPQEGNDNLPPMSPEGFQGQPPEGFQEGEMPPPPMGEFQGEPPEGMQGNFEGGRPPIPPEGFQGEPPEGRMQGNRPGMRPGEMAPTQKMEPIHYILISILALVFIAVLLWAIFLKKRRLP